MTVQSRHRSTSPSRSVSPVGPLSTLDTAINYFTITLSCVKTLPGRYLFLVNPHIGGYVLDGQRQEYRKEEVQEAGFRPPVLRVALQSVHKRHRERDDRGQRVPERVPLTKVWIAILDRVTTTRCVALRTSSPCSRKRSPCSAVTSGSRKSVLRRRLIAVRDVLVGVCGRL